MKKNTKSLLFSLSLLLVCWCLLQVYGGCGRGRMRTEARQNLSNKAMAEGAGEEKKKFSIWDLPDVPMGQLPPHLELQRSRVSCNKDAPIHTESIQYSGAYASMGIDNSSRLDRFSNNFRVEVVRLNEDDMEFDMIVIDAAIANSFRRILIAELPTMAIEKVLIAKKTSIIQDEVLAHRLGLVPIRVDPRLFDYLSENDQPNEKNTIVFKLHVQCKRGDKNI